MFTALSGISVNDLQPSPGTVGQSSTPGATIPKQVPAPASQADTVKLSITQQVRNLHSEGEGPGQIASSLGLDSSQVNNDLYVSLTWPQLLSKVASSSLSLGPASSDASVSGSSAPVAAAASIFPTSQAAGGSSAGATPGTKDASKADLVVFPAAKDTPTPAATDTSFKSLGKDATAA